MQQESSSDGVYFTTNPKQLLSWNTLFNAAVWSGGAAFAGSYFDIPTPYGEFSLASSGATAGLVGYGGLVIYNRGITGFFNELWSEVQQDFVDWGGKKTPIDPGKAKAFFDKYGVTWQDAIQRYYQEDINRARRPDPGGMYFMAWVNRTYLAMDITGQIGDAPIKPDEHNHQIGDDAPIGQPVKGGPVQRGQKRKGIDTSFGFVTSTQEGGDPTSLLILLAGTAAGILYDQPMAGALVGTAGAIMYKRTKRVTLQEFMN